MSGRRYTEDKLASNELLRLILPKLAACDAPCHPTAYAVWYEHLSGINQALSRAIEARLAEGNRLPEAEIAALHDQYVREPDNEMADQTRFDLERLLCQVADQIKGAGNEVTNYSESLQQRQASLKTDSSPAAVAELIRTLIGDTSAMQQSAREVTGRLEESRTEATQLREALQRACTEACTDPLTKLLNRRAFDSGIAELAAEAGKNDTPLCLVMADIDHFKRVNDKYGHMTGDNVIRAVAGVLKAGTKGRDLAARYGGEEFAVVLPETGIEGAKALSEQIRATVARGTLRRHGSGESIGNVTISLGVALWRTGESVNTLIEHADKALYASKQGGRNRVTVAA